MGNYTLTRFVTPNAGVAVSELGTDLSTTAALGLAVENFDAHASNNDAANTVTATWDFTGISKFKQPTSSSDATEIYIRRSQTVILNGTTSYTIPSGVRGLIVHLVGGGGAGGGAATAASDGASGGGGGGGGYTYSLVDVSIIPASPVTVAVGAGGTAGSAGNNPGNNGGDTTFNVTQVVAKGGTGGTGGAAKASADQGGGGGAGGVAGTTAGAGGVSVPGGAGTTGAVPAPTTLVLAGLGGRATGPYGGAGAAPANWNSGAGVAGSLYGGGGSGGIVVNGASQVAGGAGANGIMVVEEYI